MWIMNPVSLNWITHSPTGVSTGLRSNDPGETLPMPLAGVTCWGCREIKKKKRLSKSREKSYGR